MSDGGIIESLLYLETQEEWVQWEKEFSKLLECYLRRRGTWSQLHHLQEVKNHLNKMEEVLSNVQEKQN